jgi:lysophospholipase
MGGAIATLFLQRHQQHCDAIALCAPMFGIVMRFPDWMVRHILDWAEGHQRIREEYAWVPVAGGRCPFRSTC